MDSRNPLQRPVVKYNAIMLGSHTNTFSRPFQTIVIIDEVFKKMIQITINLLMYHSEQFANWFDQIIQKSKLWLQIRLWLQS